MCQSINFFGHSFVIILLLADRTILMIATLFQLRSSFQYQCFGSHGPADHQSTCMFPWVGLPGSLSPATSVCFFRVIISIQNTKFIQSNGSIFVGFGLYGRELRVDGQQRRYRTKFCSRHVGICRTTRFSHFAPPEPLCGILSLVGVQFYENGNHSL